MNFPKNLVNEFGQRFPQLFSGENDLSWQTLKRERLTVLFRRSLHKLKPTNITTIIFICFNENIGRSMKQVE